MKRRTKKKSSQRITPNGIRLKKLDLSGRKDITISAVPITYLEQQPMEDMEIIKSIDDYSFLVSDISDGIYEDIYKSVHDLFRDFFITKRNKKYERSGYGDRIKKGVTNRV